jgi:hypothetical protein
MIAANPRNQERQTLKSSHQKANKFEKPISTSKTVQSEIKILTK